MTLHGCLLCGEARESALEFHHTESALAFKMDKERALVDKCVVLCRNCHEVWGSALRERGVEPAWGVGVLAD